MKPDQLVSQHGNATTVRVGVLRGLTILSSALVFASLGWVLSYLFMDKPLDAVPTHLWVLVVLGGLGAVCSAFLEMTYSTKHARLEERALRAKILRRYFASAVEGKTAPGGKAAPPARYIALLTDSVERVTEYKQVYWGATVASVIAPLLLVLYILALDWLTGLAILVIIPLVPAAIWFFFKYFRKVSGNSRVQREKLSVSYLDAIRQLVTIRLYGAGERVENSLRAKDEENRRAVMKLLAANQLVIIVMDAVFLVVLICWSVLVISWRTQAGALTTGQALSALLILPLLLEPLSQVAGFFYIGMGGRASARVISRFLASGILGAGHPGGGHPGAHPAGHPGDKSAGHPGGRPARSDKPTGRRPVSQSEAAVSSKPVLPPLDTSAAISVRGLTHDFGRGAVLKELSFDIPTGARVAIIGPSGVGKSTLLSLLRGTLKIQDGAIAVTGTNFASVSPEQACLTSASVSQKTWLFTGTIEDNLRFAAPSASEAQLWEALEQAHLAEDIRGMHEGLQTNVGEQGSLISGGQAQRLSLARAFLSGRKVLLLDEPTSQIDRESETEIIDALAQLEKDTTLVMVTHRESLLELADTVFELTREGLTIRPVQEVRRAN